MSPGDGGTESVAVDGVDAPVVVSKAILCYTAEEENWRTGYRLA